MQFRYNLRIIHLQLYNVNDTATESAPTITVCVSSSTSSHYIDVLPDSGADISAAGQEMLHALGHHIDNSLPSTISPRIVNGSSMAALGKIPITTQLGTTRYKDELHIYPGVSSALILWKAAKGLAIMLFIPSSSVTASTQWASNSTRYSKPASGKPVSNPGFNDTISHSFWWLNPHHGGREVPHHSDRGCCTILCQDTASNPIRLQRQIESRAWPVARTRHHHTSNSTRSCSNPQKGSDRIRMCVNLSHQNRDIKRERYQSPTPAEAVAVTSAKN